MLGNIAAQSKTKLHSYIAVWVKKKRKVLPEPYGPQSGADLRFLRPSARHQFFYCETTDTGPVYRAVRLFTSQQWSRYQIILLGDRGTCVWTTCLRSLPGIVLVRSRTCAPEWPQDYKSGTLPLDYRATQKLSAPHVNINVTVLVVVVAAVVIVAVVAVIVVNSATYTSAMTAVRRLMALAMSIVSTWCQHQCSSTSSSCCSNCTNSCSCSSSSSKYLYISYDGCKTSDGLVDVNSLHLM